MDIVYSVALLGLAVVLFNVFLLGCRMPDQPGWASEGVISDLWCVSITGLIAFGAAFGVQFILIFKEESFGLMEVAMVASLLAVFYLTHRAITRRGQMAQTAGELARGSRVSDPSPATSTTLRSSALYNHSPGEPTLPKVA